MEVSASPEDSSSYSSVAQSFYDAIRKNDFTNVKTIGFSTSERVQNARLRLNSRSNHSMAHKVSKYLPLHYTAACGEIKLSEYLLDQGANVDAMDADGNTALMWAIRKGHADLAYILIEKHGANVNAINFDGETPLMLAALVMNRDLLNYLLMHGANPNATNLRGETALHVAVAMNSVELIEELLLHGCWLEARDECGETALHWAVRESLLDVVDYLLAHGANPDALNDDDESSAHFAELFADKAMQAAIDSYRRANESKFAGVAGNVGFGSKKGNDAMLIN